MHYGKTFTPPLALFLERTLGTEHLHFVDKGRRKPRPSDSRWRGQMLSMLTFRGGANIDVLDKRRSTLFSPPVNKSTDLCGPMYLLQKQ